MKVYTTNGTGTEQTLNEASSNRIKVFPEVVDTSVLINNELVATETMTVNGDLEKYIDNKFDVLKSKNFDWDKNTRSIVPAGTGQIQITDFIERPTDVSFTLRFRPNVGLINSDLYYFYDWLFTKYNLNRFVPHYAHGLWKDNDGFSVTSPVYSTNGAQWEDASSGIGFRVYNYSFNNAGTNAGYTAFPNNTNALDTRNAVITFTITKN